MRVLCGTSGYNYDTWRGHFYPPDLKAAARLAFYAARFPTVEINYTFYRRPTEKTYLGWASETPAGFTFALKASRFITQTRRLADVEEPVRSFWDSAGSLGDKRGPVLFGLHPTFKKDAARLRAFLATLPPGLRAAFEFRHPSWFDDETYAALREARASLCIADADELETPCVATAPWGYLRLRKEDYDRRALDAWAGRVLDAGWTDDVYIYFKHEDDGRGPELARQLADRIRGPGKEPTSGA